MELKIVSDSSCDLLALDGVPFSVVPLKIVTDRKEYIDNESLNVELMIEELREYKGKSSTSCPNVKEWEEAFQDAEGVFAVTITSGLSGSYQAALAAKALCEEKDSEKQIHVFDTRSAGPEMVLLIGKIRDLIRKGESFETICDQATAYQKRTHLIFALESMHNFAQNGRVGKIAAAAAGVLGIRVLGRASQAGTLELLTKCRGAAKTVAAFLAELKKLGYAGGKINIAQCLNEEGAKGLKNAILSEFASAEISVYPLRGLCSYYAERGGILLGFES